MLDYQDEQKIKEIVEEVVDVKIKHLPTKDDFYTKMDSLMGEVKAIREEFALHTGQHQAINDTLENHSERIKALEKRQKSSPTPLV